MAGYQPAEEICMVAPQQPAEEIERAPAIYMAAAQEILFVEHACLALMDAL